MTVLRPDLVRQEIENLRLRYPELQDDSDAWELTLGSETSAVECLESIVRQIEDVKILAEGTKLRIDELGERKSKFERRQEMLRELALKIIEATGQRKWTLPCATLSLRDIPPKPVITDEDALPDFACRFIRKPDIAKIKELLETGPVAGVAMSNGGIGLTLRVR